MFGFSLHFSKYYSFFFKMSSLGSPTSVFRNMISRTGERTSIKPKILYDCRKWDTFWHFSGIRSSNMHIKKQNSIAPIDNIIKYFHTFSVKDVFLKNFSPINITNPEIDKMPWMQAIMAINPWAQKFPPIIHMNVHTTFEPKWAYFKAKYKLAHIIITVEARRFMLRNRTPPKNSCVREH